MKQFIKNWLLPPSILFTLVYYKQLFKNHLLYDNRFFEQNEKIKNIHQGERCFIIGAGPSIKEQNLKKLKDEYCISVSNVFVHPDYKIFKPKYHVLPSIIAHNMYSEEEFAKWLQEMEEKTLDAKMFFHAGDKKFIDKYKLFNGRAIYWNAYVPWNEQQIQEIDLFKIPSVWSVSEYAIMVALYLGFEKIYLIGFDHDWFNGPLVYFHDRSEHKVPISESKISFADSEFQMRRHAYIFKKYKCMFNMEKNIFNANANMNTYVDVFPKVDFNSLFK